MKFIQPRINGAGHELTPEATVQLTLMLVCIYAAQLIGNRFIRVLDNEGIKDYFVQNQKRKLSDAVDYCRKMLSSLEAGYDAQFDKLLGGRKDRYDVVQYKANFLVRLGLLAFSRVDANDKMYHELPKEIRKHKTTTEYDVEQAIEYYQK